MKVPIEVDFDKFRYSLVGRGYNYNEVLGLSTTEMIRIIEKRIHDKIDEDYEIAKPMLDNARSRS